MSDAPDTIDQAEAECERALAEYPAHALLTKDDALLLMRYAFHRGASWGAEHAAPGRRGPGALLTRPRPAPETGDIAPPA